ncbi:PilZ domain-containing protein [Devosia sp. RR2S18]|uniref:PilZ domain-containing protein n=1 Tax=Devosia rhizosphaerae TaxID=3049774 RepID=UPI00253F67B5|nr:PilZ domain-containing protein [Devosia sp. RR2S18]WIJ23544.1 PilZ domain-containing protein [Devosia sp. RR2S18]
MFQEADEGLSPRRSEFDWHDVRFIGAAAGRYALPDRRSAQGGKAPVYACRLSSISTKLLVAVGPVLGKTGELVSAFFDEFGMIKGRIHRSLPEGFVLELTLSDKERDKLGAKIAWHKKKVHEQVPDKREAKRFLPRDPRTLITLGDGARVPGFIIDVSCSGVAVSADLEPSIGTPMAVGKLVGRVVRHLDVGFAIQFLQVQERERVEALLAPPQD